MPAIRSHGLLVLVFLMLVAALVAPARAAAELAVSKSSPAQVLAGDPVTFTLSATNTGDAPEFNLSFRDELPAGVTYVPGSASPADAGDPQIITNSVETPRVRATSSTSRP